MKRTSSIHAGPAALRAFRRPARALSLLAALLLAPAAHAQFTAQGLLTDTRGGTVAWGDYNDDGYLDLLLTGDDGTGYVAEVYPNSPTGFGAPIALATGVAQGSRAAWVNLDNDADLEVLVTGSDNSASFGLYTTTLYDFNGVSFSSVALSPALPGLAYSSIAWGDYDNDGDPDLFLSGREGTNTFSKPRSYLLRNNGAGGFNVVNMQPLPPLAYGSSAWIDHDNDGDMDLAYCGYPGAGTPPQTMIYTNNNGVFQPTPISLPGGLHHSSMAWGDYNNDGKIDLAMTGVDVVGNIVFWLFDGPSLGTAPPPVPGKSLPTAVSDGSLAWGDYDNDGRLDLLVVGHTTTGAVSEVWAGDGAGGFTLAASLTGVEDGQGAWGDYDNDGRLDVAITGWDPVGSVPFSEVYLSSTPTANTPPNAPTITSLVSTAKSISLNWTGSDVETTAPHYNIELTDVTSGTVTVMSSMSNTGGGYHRVPVLGNAGYQAGWTITGLRPGHTYDVCVQTVDGAFAGSPFTCSTGITLPSATYDMMIRDCPADGGSEPSTICPLTPPPNSVPVMWASPDVWCRDLPDLGTTHQDPSGGTMSYVHVRVTNISTSATHPGGLVQVFYAKASTSLIWQGSWVNNTSTLTYGDLIGSASVGPVGPGNSDIVYVPWSAPDPSDYGGLPGDEHFCLLARFVAADDPMKVTETWDVAYNTINNNNIAWRNVSIIDIDGPNMAPPIIETGNPFETVEAMALHFDVGDDSETMLEHVAVTVDLGDMYQLWVNGGSEGENVRPHSADADNTKIDITGAGASISNISIPAGESYGLTYEFTAGYEAGLAGHTFNWHVSQYREGAASPFGGETFNVIMPESGGEKGALSQVEAAREYRLGARPNPTTGATTISYELPSDARVTLGIYDASGTLVRALVAPVEQKRGGHEIEWDGVTADGERAVAGTYFYRLEAGSRRAEGQIKIVR